MSARILAVIFAALIGAGAGAAVYAALDSDDGTTVIRQVQVTQSLQAANRTGTGLTVGAVYKLAHKAVVEITVTSSDSFSGQTQQAQGSGFVYGRKGDVLTNQHVVDHAQSIKVMLWNGKSYPARLIGGDPSTDTAVIRVDAPASMLQPLELGDSDDVEVGDPVVAIGSPFGLQDTVTAGIVSALHRQMTSPNKFTIDNSIQTDAAINHGNSGGPLLNMQGKVIGINSQIESDSGGNDGVGFAVPANTVRKIATKLITTGRAEHAYLGVQLDAAAGGARVVEVVAGKPAAKAGIHVDDVITSFAGEKVSTVDDLRFAVDDKQPGDSVSVTFKRGGDTRTVTVKLAARPS